MNLSEPFVRRPVATVLLTIGLALSGIGAFFVLPVSPLPQVDFPAISVSASLPGASPDTMASSVATPLERRLGVISGVNEMTSFSGNGSTRVSLQFDLNRKIDAAAREVQAAINFARVGAQKLWAGTVTSIRNGLQASAARDQQMNLSEPFVRRPVATVLLTLGK